MGRGARTGRRRLPPLRSRMSPDDFDWEGDRPLETPLDDLVIYEMHVRGLTRAPVVRREVPGHVRRRAREDPVPEGPRRQLRRAAARLRIRRVREQPTRPGRRHAADELLGLQHRRLLRAEGRLRRDRAPRDAGRRVQDPGQGSAQERHRGHPRRGVQPHRRGQRERAVLSRSAASTTRPTTCSRRTATTTTSAGPATR